MKESGPSADIAFSVANESIRRHSRCGLHTRAVTYFVTRYPKASDISSPPCLLRLLPAGRVAGWDLQPREKRRLVTAHTRTDV